MGKAKRALSVIMAALMLVFTCMTYVPTFAAENTSSAPEIAFVGVDHSPLVVGDTETFSLTTANADKVQYNVVLKDATGKVVEDLTKGYTAETAGNVPYELKATTVFALGKYTLDVTAKRVSDSTVSKTYTANLNCVTKDDANRVYANGAMVTDKDSYVIGDKVTVSEVKGLAGIAGPYKYRLHVYNATTGEWTKNVVANYGDKIEWTPSAPGTYVLDVHINTEKSTTWAKYAANPTSSDVYGTYEAWKLKTIVVEDSLKVTDVKAPNQKTVKVTFNKDLGTVNPVNFSIAEKDDQYSLVNIESVSVSKNVATITTYDSLSDATSYVLTTTDVPSADGKLKLATATNEFKYVDVTDVASIAFKATTVAQGKTVDLIIKDKDGNDITPNFDLADILDVEISNETYVKYDDVEGVLNAVATGKAIVNVAVADTDVETGNTIITVSNTLQAATSVGPADIAAKVVDKVTGDVSYTYDYEDPSLVVYENDVESKINFQALNQDGEEINDKDISDKVVKEYKSLTPSVLVVDTNANADGATLIPLKTGTAQVLLKATFKDETVSKVVTVTVKGERTATSLKVDKTSVKVVGGSDIKQTVTATLYDQYGDEMDIVDGDAKLSVKSDDPTLIDIKGETTGGAFEVTADPTIDTDKTATKYATVTYDNGDVVLKATFTVSLVKPGTFAGYAAVADDTKLDLYAGNDDSTPDHSVIHIYEKDTNGNYIRVATPAVVLLETSNDNVTTDGALTVNAADTGSSTVTVKVGNDVTASLVKIGTINFTVVNTKPVATTFAQTKATIVVKNSDNEIFAKLFGEDGAFSAKDQNGDSVTINASDVDVYSTNSSLVKVTTDKDVDGNKTISIAADSTNTGSVKLIVVADKVYEITVVVEK